MASIAWERATRVDGAAPWGRESRGRLPRVCGLALAALGDADRKVGAPSRVRHLRRRSYALRLAALGNPAQRPAFRAAVP